MLRKLPAAMVIAALLLAIPGIWALVSTGDDAPPTIALTPAVDGVRSADARAAFWQDRIAGPTDWLNRVHAGAAQLEAARQSGDPADYEAALAFADAALLANPTSDDARTLRAATLSSAHRFDEALTEARTVLASDANAFQAHAVAGDALLELGRYDEADNHLDALVRLQPQAPAVLSRLAEFAWDTDDTTGALSYGEQALLRANEAGLSSGELSFYAIRLARFRLDTGDLTGAADLAAEALRIAPEVPAVHSTVGFVRLAEGRSAEAIDAFEAAVAITPLREALVELVTLHETNGDVDALAEAASLLEALGPAPEVG
ncbi:MAG: tetratricopeptide repeat protein [Actinomycetota bacterium]